MNNRRFKVGDTVVIKKRTERISQYPGLFTDIQNAHAGEKAKIVEIIAMKRVEAQIAIDKLCWNGDLNWYRLDILPETIWHSSMFEPDDKIGESFDIFGFNVIIQKSASKNYYLKEVNGKTNDFLAKLYSLVYNLERIVKHFNGTVTNTTPGCPVFAKAENLHRFIEWLKERSNHTLTLDVANKDNNASALIVKSTLKDDDIFYNAYKNSSIVSKAPIATPFYFTPKTFPLSVVNTEPKNEIIIKIKSKHIKIFN